MQELNLIDCFNKAAAQSVLIATYEFNPEFFERRLLALRGFETASRIVVFMDASCYTELLRGGLAAAPWFQSALSCHPSSLAIRRVSPQVVFTAGEERFYVHGSERKLHQPRYRLQPGTL